MATRPEIALTSAYGVVTEQQAEIKQLEAQPLEARRERDEAIAARKAISCKEPDCYGRTVAHGLCMKHYRRVLRNGTTEIRPRGRPRHVKQCRQCGADYIGTNKRYCSRGCFARSKMLPRIDGKKRCSRCGEYKALAEYYKTSTPRGDGHMSHCKDCARVDCTARQRAKLARDPDAVRAQRREYQRKWRQRRLAR